MTARNIFRYKTRMFMTIFGVCGAVSLLTAGLAVQSSIGQIGNRQFEELIHYDLIVAEESDTNSAQRKEIATTLKGKTVQSSTAVRYEELSKTAGKENDKQSITLLATDDAYNFNEYLTLRDRKTHQPQILVNNGAVISERLAEMLNVSVGDTFTVNDENGAQRTIKVAGISEMYIGHFIFMNAQCYEHVFGDQYSTNAYMVRLKDHSNANTERQGAKFMKLAAVRGVVQNTTQKNMVSTIVGSLNQIMEVLILVAVLLAVVILYNLTNLNVSERIRELSTIKVLGFHTSETTMYIYRETILLSLLGILAGYGFGEWLHRYIITEVPPDEVMFDPAISWIALAAPAIVVAVVLAVLGWIVYRQLETVDMLEALKSWNDPPRNGQRSSSPKARGTAATTSPATIGCPIALAGVLPACPYRCGRCHPRCSDPLAIAPASPCIYAAAVATSGTKAGSSDSMSSCCASNAPNTPANTSPEPAVAIQAGARPDRMIRVFPSPSAPTTMVTAPLSSTVAPVSSCARNAARNGRASTHCLETTSAISASNRFSNAANSPACGVITTCGTTWHGSKSNAPASTTMGGMPSARSFREPSPSSNA
ncbi:efflux ABC transporter, permease protein [Bifidobacterium adolescentis]|uniref:Efflux ABC transporter, permease protein n=1 Tax=Bifidobacterium adolescentis TaxID=1680 RepID=A0AB73P2I0_BIFAD|nr:efflux ABC transporter, permease protein [Bifidobacterium adolescentis]